MKYINHQNFEHGQSRKIGVLITNLGTPQAPETSAVRRYLKQFLSDSRVVEIPRVIWWFILNCIILVLRPPRSAAAYRKIWSPEGSPLLVHTKAQAQALQKSLTATHGNEIIVDFAMRYGEPSIADKVQGLLDKGVRRLLVIPLYPHYSGPTTASTFDALAADFGRRRWLPELRFVTHYHDYPPFIRALANKIGAHWAEHGRADKLVFSYHGEPKRCLDLGDPYHCECYKTTRLVAEMLSLDESEYLTTFQSRFGRAEWLRPYTDEVLKALPGEGSKTVQIVCPGFSADCLETLEEIDVENREYFMTAGGERYEYIPCLNSDPGHIEALSQLVVDQLSGWINNSPDTTDTKSLAAARGATH